MLFHTYLFIFAFLPATLLAFFLAAKVSKRLPIFVLIAGSLIFYAYWMPEVTLLLAGSIVFNYFAGLFLQGDADWTWTEPLVTERDDLFRAQAESFLEAATGQHSPLCSLEDGALALRVNLAALESGATGQRCKVGV